MSTKNAKCVLTYDYNFILSIFFEVQRMINALYSIKLSISYFIQYIC